MKKSTTKSASKPTAKKSIKSTSTERSVPLNVDNNSSVNIREIANGFLVSESGYTGKGKNQQSTMV